MGLSAELFSAADEIYRRAGKVDAVSGGCGRRGCSGGDALVWLFLPSHRRRADPGSGTGVGKDGDLLCDMEDYAYKMIRLLEVFGKETVEDQIYCGKMVFEAVR